MIEDALPEDTRRKASVDGKEFAWRMSNVEETIVAARDAGPGCLGLYFPSEASIG